MKFTEHLEEIFHVGGEAMNSGQRDRIFQLSISFMYEAVTSSNK